MRQGLYLYCVVPSHERQGLPPKGRASKGFGTAGISGKAVYPLNYRNLALVVHDCPPIPYNSSNPKKVAEWIKTHHQVVDRAWEAYGGVLPFSFNMIVRETPKENAFDNAIHWLETNYDLIQTRIKELNGKAEFGIQIFWDRERAAQKFLENDSLLLSLQNELKSKGKGAQFLIQEKMQKTLRLILERQGTQYTQEILDKVKNAVFDYKIEKVKEGEILAFSCLAEKENPAVGERLAEIEKSGQLKVRFAGPFPPYSFAKV